jgi:hypothetical protein
MNLLPSVVETAFGIIAPALSLSYNRCSHFLPLRRLPSIGLGGFLSMLSRLQLGDFRNYRQLDIALSPSLNVILGDNGSGKTSLLEPSILLVAVDDPFGVADCRGWSGTVRRQLPSMRKS